MIPEQLEGYNFAPLKPEAEGDNKGNWFIGKNKIIDICRYLDFPFSDFPEDGWSKNGDYVSWTSMPNIPSIIRDHILKIAIKNGQDLVIKTGLQPDGRFLSVFDCDGVNAKDYRNFIQDTYGDTFIRKTRENGYHLYYYASKPLFNEKQDINFRHYICIDNTPLEMEYKQGKLIKVIGKGRSTYMDKDISILNEDIDFFQAIKKRYPTAYMINPYKKTGNPSTYEEKESFDIAEGELKEIFDTKYLPRYRSDDLQGIRDDGVFLATMGFLRRRGLKREKIEVFHSWIDNIPGMDTRNYDLDHKPEYMAGEPKMREYGFNEFVDAINSLNPFKDNKRKSERVFGEHTINTVALDYPTNHLPMFKELQGIMGIHSNSHKHALKMIYYSMVSTINGATNIYLYRVRHDPRISTILVMKAGQGKTSLLDGAADILKRIGMSVHRPTTFHSDQWIGKTISNKKEGVRKIFGYLNDDVVIIDEAKRLISDPDFGETRKNARISQNRYGSSPVEKKNVDTHNKDKITYDSKTVLMYGVQDIKLDAEDFIIEGDSRRFAISVLDNETIDKQEDIITSQVEHGTGFINPQVFSDFLNEITRLPGEIFVTLGAKERALWIRAVTNLNDRANSYSKMVTEYYGTLGAEYSGLFLKFVINTALIRMASNGIESQQVKITWDDILYAYVDCFEMLEHRYEWTHFYLVMESALVHKGAKYEKEIDVLTSFGIGERVKKATLKAKISEIYNITERSARETVDIYINNKFIREINAHTIEIIKYPGERVERKDDQAIEMYSHALEKIRNLKTCSPINQIKIEGSDWDVSEAINPQSALMEN